MGNATRDLVPMMLSQNSLSLTWHWTVVSPCVTAYLIVLEIICVFSWMLLLSIEHARSLSCNSISWSTDTRYRCSSKLKRKVVKIMLIFQTIKLHNDLWLTFIKFVGLTTESGVILFIINIIGVFYFKYVRCQQKQFYFYIQLLLTCKWLVYLSH